MEYRDLTKAQFAKQLEKRGMIPELMGYINIGNGRCVYRFNGGDKLRSQLAYLIKEQRSNHE